MPHNKMGGIWIKGNLVDGTNIRLTAKSRIRRKTQRGKWKDNYFFERMKIKIQLVEFSIVELSTHLSQHLYLCNRDSIRSHWLNSLGDSNAIKAPILLKLLITHLPRLSFSLGRILRIWYFGYSTLEFTKSI